MSAETDKLIDEYLRSRNVPLLGLGDEYIWDGKTHIYCEHLFPTAGGEHCAPTASSGLGSVQVGN